MKASFRPSPALPGMADVLVDGAETHYGDGIADRFALYEGDTWQEGAREYIEDSGWTFVSESDGEVVAAFPIAYSVDSGAGPVIRHADDALKVAESHGCGYTAGGFGDDPDDYYAVLALTGHAAKELRPMLDAVHQLAQKLAASPAAQGVRVTFKDEDTDGNESVGPATVYGAHDEQSYPVSGKWVTRTEAEVIATKYGVTLEVA